MAKIKKLQEGGVTIYPATITNAVKDPTTGKTLPELLGDGVQSDGTYPKMTAGFAENIVGDGSATTEVFSFRPTAGEDRNVANTTYYDGERNGVARIEKVIGNSVVLNQVVNSRGTTTTTNGITLNRNADGSYTISGTATANAFLWVSSEFDQVDGHKYFISGGTGNIAVGGYMASGLTTYKKPTIAAATRTAKQMIAIYIASGSVISSPITIRPLCVDLTRMYQSGNEPTTIKEFYQRLPKGVNINAYNKGEIIDGKYGTIKTVGFNAFNGTYAKVCGGCPYYLGGNYTSLGFATEKGGTTEAITLPTSVESVGTTPSDRLYTPAQNGYIYADGENININLSWDTEYGYLNGTYQPYKPFYRALSWMNKYFPNGMRSAGSVRDEIRFNSTTQRWEAVQNVGVRAYAEGDNENPAVITDGTNTNYTLVTPIVTEIDEDINMDFDVSDYGTEELIVAEGEKSAALVADIVYEPNALNAIKQVPDILKRLKALESAVAQQTTNVEPSNVEE